MPEMIDKSPLIDACPRLMHLTAENRLPVSINPTFIRIIDKLPHGGTLILMEASATTVTDTYEDVLQEYQRASM